MISDEELDRARAAEAYNRMSGGLDFTKLSKSMRESRILTAKLAREGWTPGLCKEAWPAYAQNIDHLAVALSSRLSQVGVDREVVAQAGYGAKLPEHFQWGDDAMEQFNFGKKRATDASSPTPGRTAANLEAALEEIDRGGEWPRDIARSALKTYRGEA